MSRRQPSPRGCRYYRDRCGRSEGRTANLSRRQLKNKKPPVLITGGFLLPSALENPAPAARRLKQGRQSFAFLCIRPSIWLGTLVGFPDFLRAKSRPTCAYASV